MVLGALPKSSRMKNKRGNASFFEIDSKHSIHNVNRIIHKKEMIGLNSCFILHSFSKSQLYLEIK